MIKYRYLILLCLLLSFKVFAQDMQDSLNVLKNELESFQYNNVISYADSILKQRAKLKESDVIEIYRFKAIAQYSLQNNDGAKLSFIEILRIDTSYALDSAKTSPKIIGFFNQVKNEYLQLLNSRSQFIKTKIDTVYIPKLIPDENSAANLKQALIRSVIIPGLGHLYLGENLKGTILTTLSAITIGSAIYFLIDSNKKERLYLNAISPYEVQQKYNSYNTSFKLKDISFISFAVVWVYSQIDLLFLSGKNPIELPSINIQPSNQFQMDFQVRF